MAKNESGTFVHVHGEGGQTTVVAPGEDFPDDFEATEDLTKSAESDEEQEIPGPGQFPADVRRGVADPGGKSWKDVKVPELRKMLDVAEVSYEDGDRKDVLVEKAEAAQLTPESPTEKSEA